MVESRLNIPKPDPDEWPSMTMAQFLEESPPNSVAVITDAEAQYEERRAPGLHRPDLQLHCTEDACGGVRTFFCSEWQPALSDKSENRFVTYLCRNCLTTIKVFAFCGMQRDGRDPVMRKIGEVPTFGPPLPSRVMKLVGPDRDLLLAGRRCENQSLGIGAFSYYRRIVENQWQRIVGEIMRVAERVGGDAAIIDGLKNAAKETQFKKAVKGVAPAIPQQLNVCGSNPLTLLHKALSEGLHAESDETCLQLAHDIRLVLTELADRVSAVLKDEAALRAAVNRLNNKPQKDTDSERSAAEG